MQWENLTSEGFAKAVKETGVCILTLGILEKHGQHLPLGTDYLNGHKVACLAAEREPAVVFPPFYFGQIYEARCYPGTIAIEPTLMMQVIWGVLDEIGRNGFKKIIVANCHGGNNHLAPFLAQCSLWQEKPYCIYIPGHTIGDSKRIEEVLETKEPGSHGDEWETSLVYASYPELVKMEKVPKEPARPLGRLKHLPPYYTGIWWYGEFPDHYAGDARTASVEKGKKFQEIWVDSLAEFIAAVKKDETVPALNKEFFQKVRDVSK